MILWPVLSLTVLRAGVKSTSPLKARKRTASRCMQMLALLLPPAGYDKSLLATVVPPLLSCLDSAVGLVGPPAPDADRTAWNEYRDWLSG